MTRFAAALLLLTFLAAPCAAEEDLPPVITSFVAYPVFGDWWSLEGTIEDEVPEWNIVFFGGAAYGHYCYGNTDGTFVTMVRIDVEPGLNTASAQAYDVPWQESNVAYTPLVGGP